MYNFLQDSIWDNWLTNMNKPSSHQVEENSFHLKGSIHNSSQTPAAVSGAGFVNVVIYDTWDV